MAAVRGIAAAALACAALLAGCGGSSAGTPPAGVQGPALGVPLRLADCRDWRQADTTQRLGAVHELRAFAGGPVGQQPGHGNVLDDKTAYKLMQYWCGKSFARGFKLYKIYEHAAAFTPSQQGS